MLCSQKKGNCFQCEPDHRNIVTEIIQHLSTNLKDQFVTKGNIHTYILSWCWWTCWNVCYCQVSIFIFGVNSNLCIREEFLGLCHCSILELGRGGIQSGSCPRHHQTSVRPAPACGIDNRCITHDVWAQKLIGDKALEKMQESVTCKLPAYQCIIHQESLCGKA